MNNRSVHHDEHLVPARVAESRLDAFQTGRNTLGAVFDRVGGAGGTEVSANAHHVAGAGRAAVELAKTGQV